MRAIRRRPNILLALALVCLSSSLHAAVVETKPLTAAIGMMQSVPAFRASVLEQVGLVSSLSAQSVPTLSPLVSATPLALDPWRVPAMQLVGAMVTQPQAIAAHQDELRAALGKQGVESLQKAAKNLQANASKDSVLQAQFNNLRSGLDLNDAGAVQKLGERLSALFDNSASRPIDASGGAVAAPDSAGKNRPSRWKLQPATALPAPKHASPAVALPASNGNPSVLMNGGAVALTEASGLSFKRLARTAAYADQFTRIPGVDSVKLAPITRVATLVEVPTGRTDVFVNFHSAEALATARKSGSLPLFGDLRGWFTGYHIIARVSPEVVARERAALDESYRERFSKIPGVDSVELSPITRVATIVEVPTGRTDVFVNFHSAEALAAAKKSGSFPLFGDMRGWITGYHVIARVNPSGQNANPGRFEKAD